jgi:hypothetical protein
MAKRAAKPARRSASGGSGATFLLLSATLLGLGLGFIGFQSGATARTAVTAVASD